MVSYFLAPCLIERERLLFLTRSAVDAASAGAKTVVTEPFTLFLLRSLFPNSYDACVLLMEALRAGVLGAVPDTSSLSVMLGS